MANWGPQAFEGGSWTGSGIDSVNVWLNQDPGENDAHGLTSDPLHLIGSGSQSARGMVDAAREGDVWGGSYTDEVGLYGGPSLFTGISTAASHDIAANSSATRAIWRMRFAGHKPYASNPDYEDPTDNGTVGSFRGSSVPDPDEGSDSVGLMLDVTQDYQPLWASSPDMASTVNYDGEPLVSQFHRNHSMVWPFRVRMNRATAPGGRMAGWNTNAQLAQNWPTLCEARLFKATNSAGLVQFIIKLVWYGEVAPADYDLEELSHVVLSDDYILLAAYAGDVVPTNLQSPFFHFDATSAIPIWDEVECTMTATVNGSVTLKIKSLDRNFEQTISITGQDPIVSGGTNGLIPVMSTVGGQAHVDIGCAYLSTKRYGDLSGLWYPGEGQLTDAFLTWSVDEIRGEDFEVGQSSGSTVFATTFDEYMSLTDFSQPQSVDIAAWPKFEDDLIAHFQESKADHKSPTIWAGATPKNFWSERWFSLASPAEPITIGADVKVDSDGADGDGSNWQFRVNEDLHIQGISSAGGRAVLTNVFNATGTIFYPDDQAGGSIQKFGLGIDNVANGAMEGAAYKFRFRTERVGANSTFDFPGGAGTYDYWLRWPHANPLGTTGTTGRRSQVEAVLFTDSAVQTDPGASAGRGQPPNGIGIMFSPGTTSGVRVEFFVEGTAGSDTQHILLDNLDANEPLDCVLQSKEVGANVEFRFWANGIRYFTNSVGTADHTVAKSVIDADLVHGMGFHGCGSRGAGAFPPITGFHEFYGSCVFGCGAGTHQGVFQLRNDHSQQDFEAILTSGAGHLMATEDVVCGPNLTDPEGPPYFRAGRVRLSAPQSAPGLYGRTKYFSLVDPNGGTYAQPFPQLGADVPTIMTGGFPTRLDPEIVSGLHTGVGVNDDLIWWRGLFMRGRADEWIHLDGLAGTIGQPFPSGPDMFVAKGVNAILWGNQSEAEPVNNFVSSLNIQIVMVRDSGVESHSPPANPPVLDPLTEPAERFLFKLVFTEEIDSGNGDRTFTLSAFRGQVGGGFEGVAAATTQLVIAAADWAASNMGMELGCFMGMGAANNGATGGVLPGGISTTWMTEISASIATGTTSPDTTFSSVMGAAVGTQTATVTDVRGVMSDKTAKVIRDIRGRVEGDISQRLDLPLERRLLVFRRDENGNVPGSFLSSANGDWYRFGISDGMEIDWGTPAMNYGDADLQKHRITPLNINYQPNGETTMQIRQETISFTGGHLQTGMLIVYVEEVRGRGWEQDATTQAIYGGNGIKILFRGEITGISRSRERSEVVYEARGPSFMAAGVDLLELSACTVGKVAYNVEPGSIQTPYAVSKNLTFGENFVPQHHPDNFGSMLGLGQPDLIGMTLADIIEHFLNLYRHQLNGLGFFRLNVNGDMTVANGDGSATTFGPKSTLTNANKAPNINQWGYDATSSIVWRPNREAFNLIPTETLLQGRVIDIMRGLLANLPDVRLRIEPTTMRWSFETLKSLRSITINTNLPGTTVDLSDDSTETFTAAVFSSPWRKEERFDASLRDGTIQPAWLDGVDIEGGWMGPFAQIGKFRGEIVSANNFPYTDPGTTSITGPQSTIIIVKVNVGDEPLAVGTFNGATVKFLNGAMKGHRGVVKNSGQHGGFQAPFQYFYIVFEPALDGTWGTGVVDVEGDEIEVTDDPQEPTTNSASAYSRTWSDYILIEPDSGRIVNNLAPGGSWRLDEVLPNGCPQPNGSQVFKNLPANSVIRDGQLVTSPFPLASANSACQAGNSVAATACGGDIIYRAVRVQEGTWCARSPETGFAGTAYRDIIEYQGVVTAAHADGLGFIDGHAAWLPHQWEPMGGAFTSVLLVGGFRTMFSVSPPVSDTDDVNGPIGFSFVGGWDVSALDVDQSGDYFEERSLDADQNVADWNDSAGDSWDTTMGLRFKSVGGNYGPRRGCIISRHIPGVLPATAGTFTPLGLSTSTTKDTALNNNVQLVCQLTLDPNDAVTSLASVAFILRGENGFLEQLRVPPGDIPSGTPTTAFFDETLFKLDTATGQIGGATGVEFQKGLCAHAARWDGGAFATGTAPVDYIPDWISNTGSRKSFREASTPTTSGPYNGQNVLGSDGDVMDARFPFSAAGVTSIVPTRYDIGSSAFSVAQKSDKKGLELGTTGYVFRFVRGDEPDSLFDTAQSNSDRCYPTLFWYHTRIARDGSGNPVLTTTGEPVYEGVKEIIWQGNLSTGLTNVSLQNGSLPITIKFSVETPVPNGLTNRLTIAITPLATHGGSFSTYHVHDPRRIWHNQTQSPGGSDFFLRNTVDGCYSDWNMGFSMAHGAGGFGIGVGKVRMTNGSQGDNSAKPAKVTLLQIKQINRPPFNFGPGGISVGEGIASIQNDFDTNQAKVGYVTESSHNSIRFSHDEEHPDITSGTYSPSPGDHYRLFVDRGWGIARTATFVAEGLDDPNKVWIFRHMADSALTAAQDRRYVGQVAIEGIAHEVADGAVKVNIASEDGYTGLESMEQVTGGVTMEFGSQRRTVFNINQDGRGVFSKIDEILAKEAQKKAVDQLPSFLSSDAQFNAGRVGSLASAGIDPTSASGFGGTAPSLCADNVIFSDGVQQQSLLDAFLKLREEFWRILVLIDANKDSGDPPEPPVFLSGLGPEDNDPSLSPILKMMETQGRSIGDLVFNDRAYRDETDGQLYGIVAKYRTGTKGIVFAWAPVVSDKAGKYILDTSKSGRPREAGSSRITVGTGSPLSNSYSIKSDFIHPSVSVYAGTGFSAGTGATAVDGDLLTSNNVPGFNVNVSSTDVTISAADDFGPLDVLLTS